MRTKRVVPLYVFLLLFLSITLSNLAAQSRLQHQRPGDLHRAQRNRRSGPLQQGTQQRAMTMMKRPTRRADGFATNKIGLLAAPRFPIGAMPLSGALVGDINGDGKKDVITKVYTYDPNTGEYPMSISVSLGNGDGTFQAPKLSATDLIDWSNYTVLVADVNGDHKDDVLAFNWNGTGLVEVLLSNGDGTFAAPVSYPTGSNNYFAGGSAIDLNGDGKPDVMAINEDGRVYTLLNNGDGTFASATSVPYSGRTYEAVIADLNGDGKPDFADVQNDTGQVQVFLAAAGGGFQEPLLLNNGGEPEGCSIAAGDLNGDGKPDLVTANCDYINNNITVYINQGDGTFSTGTSLWGGFYSDGITIADVNGDGKNDVVVGNYFGGDVTVLLGNGDGTVRAPDVGYAVGGYPQTNPAVADFNGDGKQDIVVLDNYYSFAYLQGYGDGTFRAAQSYFSPLPETKGDWPWSMSLASGDFNGDGRPDIVVGSSGNSQVGATVFLGKPDGSLQPGVNYGGGELMYVAVGDFNGDGKLDFVASASPFEGDKTVQIFRGNGDGTFQDPQVYLVDPANTAFPQGVTAADLNGDGALDLAVIKDDGSGISVLLNDGEGGFLAPVLYPVNAGGGRQIVSADLNGDGKLDLVATTDTEVVILLGNGDGTFQAAQGTGFDDNVYAVTVGDVNGDGKPDVIATLGGNSGIAVMLGNGDGTLQPAVFYPATQDNLSDPYPSEIKIADIDRDYHPDLIWANGEYGTVGVLYGKGDGTFDGPVEFATGEYPYGVVVADMNGDGAPDVVTSNDGMTGVTVLLNAGGTKVHFAASPNPAQYGQNVTLTATITPTVRGVTAVPGGNVYMVSEQALGTPDLVNGVATLVWPTPFVGTHPTGAFYSGDASFVHQDGIFLDVVVNAATTTTSVVSSANPIVTGHSVTFTATVASATSGTPTGTVTFMDGATSLGTGTLDATGKAVLASTNLTTATHSITVVYGGDTHYSGSTSTAVVQVVLAAAPDYTLTANPTTATIKAGGSATFTITATADQYFNGTVSLSCGTLSMGVTCSFTPASLAPTNGHPAQSTLVVTTTSPYMALARPAASPWGGKGLVFLASLGGTGIFGGLLLGDFSKKRRMIALGVLIILIALGMSACGGHAKKTNPNATPTGVMTVQVTAMGTAGTTGGNTTAHPLTLNVTVTD